jgi:hypothetical protein
MTEFVPAPEPASPPAVTTAAPAAVATPAAAATPSAGQLYVTALYRDVLGREPDANGLAYWLPIANQRNYSTVAQGFVYSHEYNTDTVTKGYQDCLNRAPDANGLTYWVAKMDAGMTPEGFLAGVMDSPEFLGDYAGGNAAGAQAYTSGIVTGFYSCALRRAPDPTGEPYWINNLMGNVMSIPQVIQGFLTSPEYFGDLVTYDYQTFLRRTGAPNEIAFWVGVLQGGSSSRQVQMGFLTSAEYIGDVTQ